MDILERSDNSKIFETPFGFTLSLINGKWKMIILYLLSEFQPVRFNELKRQIGPITYKTLSRQLKELETADLVIRKEYPQIPPKVEYRLSNLGKSLIPILDSMCYWGLEQLENRGEDYITIGKIDKDKLLDNHK